MGLLVLAAGLAALAAVALAGLGAFRRGRALARALRDLSGSTAIALAKVTQLVDVLEASAADTTSRERLDASTARLRASRARLAVLTGAAAEARDALTGITRALPRK